jgi:hypothetical protein
LQTVLKGFPKILGASFPHIKVVFGGSRCTDDGVKAAATDSMKTLTGIEGRYDTGRWAYLPPAPYCTWSEAVRQNGLRL